MPGPSPSPGSFAKGSAARSRGRSAAHVILPRPAAAREPIASGAPGDHGPAAEEQPVRLHQVGRAQRSSGGAGRARSGGRRRRRAAGTTSGTARPEQPAATNRRGASGPPRAAPGAGRASASAATARPGSTDSSPATTTRSPPASRRSRVQRRGSAHVTTGSRRAAPTRQSGQVAGPVTTATTAAGCCPAAARRSAKEGRAGSGRYFSARAVPAPTRTTSASAAQDAEDRHVRRPADARGSIRCGHRRPVQRATMFSPHLPAGRDRLGVGVQIGERLQGVGPRSASRSPTTAGPGSSIRRWLTAASQPGHCRVSGPARPPASAHLPLDPGQHAGHPAQPQWAHGGAEPQPVGDVVRHAEDLPAGEALEPLAEDPARTRASSAPRRARRSTGAPVSAASGPSTSTRRKTGDWHSATGSIASR